MTGAAHDSGWKRFWDRGGFWRAVLLAAVYVTLYLAIGYAMGALWGDQVGDDILTDPLSVFLAVAAPVLLGGVLLVAFGLSVGWLRELFGPQPIRGRWWMWIFPVAVLTFNIVRFAAVDYDAYTVGTVAVVLFAGLCVGFAEELLTRGFAVDLLRRGGHRELAVALLSSLIFAGLHLTNVLSGQAFLTVGLTVAYTFFFGIAMYLTLRVTGNLIWPILLHATTDPSAILLAGGIDDTGAQASQSGLASLANLANPVVIVLGLALVWFIRGRVVRARAGAPEEPTAVTT